MTSLKSLTDNVSDYLKSILKHPETNEQLETDFGDTKNVVDMVISSDFVGELLYKFWQRSSDACPLECGEAEKQEREFKEWVKTLSYEKLIG